MTPVAQTDKPAQKTVVCQQPHHQTLASFWLVLFIAIVILLILPGVGINLERTDFFLFISSFALCFIINKNVQITKSEMYTLWIKPCKIFYLLSLRKAKIMIYYLKNIKIIVYQTDFDVNFLGWNYFLFWEASLILSKYFYSIRFWRKKYQL